MASAGVPQDGLHATVLRLISPHSPQSLAHLCVGDWDEIDRVAALHRLRPMLHYRQKANPEIPQDIRARWAEAFRASSFTALQMAGELSATVALLENAGMAPVALKGAWLAWHAYPHPALRPMRDIDLWLRPETVVAAYDLLIAHGYQVIGEQQLSIAQSVSLDKHLPALCSPRGVIVELHHRLWEIAGRMDHAAPLAAEEAIRQRALRIGRLTYLDPQDLLAHLIIHAVYDHRLDCGPLLLTDIEFLLAHATIDWERLRRAAERGGWLRGAALVLEMMRQHDPGLELPRLVPGLAAPAAMAGELMLQDLDTRQSAGVVATLRTAGIRAFAARIFARRSTPDGTAVKRDLSEEGGFSGWAGSRLLRTVRDLSRRRVRGQSRRLASLSRWLDA